MPFGAPRRMFSDKAIDFMPDSAQIFMGKHGIDCKSALAYAPRMKGRFERTVGTIKQSITKSVVQSGGDWVRALPRVLCGYSRHNNGNICSPLHQMHGVNSRMLASDAMASISKAQTYRRLIDF